MKASLERALERATQLASTQLGLRWIGSTWPRKKHRFKLLKAAGAEAHQSVELWEEVLADLRAEIKASNERHVSDCLSK